MYRILRRIAIGLCAVIVVLLALVPFVLLGLDIYLPTTACLAGDAEYDAVAMNTTYVDVRKVVTCAGVKVASVTLGEGADQLRFETYGWRGPGWPAEAVYVEFINGTVQEKRHWSLDLSLTPYDPSIGSP